MKKLEKVFLGLKTWKGFLKDKILGFLVGKNSRDLFSRKKF
jgi:hypothetical protein